jgi:glycosyltransferase involved in cell wall biosynthesis
VIKKHRITVVNTHSSKDTWVASLAAKLSGVPLLVRTRHISNRIPNNPFNFIHRLADGISTTGDFIRDELIKVNRFPPEKVQSIPSGVSLERFDPLTAKGERVRREFGISDQCQLVTMVAVYRGMKRHDLLVSAATVLRQSFPEVKFLLVGRGTDSDELKKLVSEAGLQDTIICIGHRDDIPDILSASDVVVLTSDRDEGVPQALSQAMAMQRPVVAAPIGSIPELVLDGKTGLLAKTGDAQSFAEKIERLLSDAALSESLGAAARRHILDNYTDDIMAEKTIAFYQRLLAAKSL